MARKSSSDISRPINPDQGTGWFLPVVFLVCVLGIGSVLFLANNRESNLAVAPLVPVPSLGIEGDHWHQAFGIYNCDGFQADIPQELPSTEGIHTHGDGLIHIHPFSVSASGANATIGAYLRTTQAQLTDAVYRPGPFELGASVMDESVGCNGEPATLQLAVWHNATSTGAPDEIITEDLVNFRFSEDAASLVLALVPDGVQIPPPPSGQQISGVSPTSPLVEDPAQTVPLVEGDSGTGGNDAPSTTAAIPDDEG